MAIPRICVRNQLRGKVSRSFFVTALVIFLAGVGIGCVFAQSDDVQVIASNQPIIISQIKVEGLSNTSRDVVLSAIKMQEGNTFSPAKFKEVVRTDLLRLHNLGVFDRIQVQLLPGDEGKYIVVITVEEMPILHSVEITGNTVLKTKDLEKDISLNPGERLDKTTMQEDINKITDKYTEKGYRNAKVEAVIDQVESGINLTYKVTEGERITVRRITFSGNSVLSDWNLRNKIMKTKEDRFYNTKTLDKEVLAEDIANIEKAYADKGYIRAKISEPEIVDVPKKSQVDILIKIEEGSRYRFEGVDFAGATKFTPEELRQLIDLKDGGNYSQEKADSGKESIVTSYYNQGYIFADVNEEVKIDDNTGTVRVDFKITEGELAHIRKIDIVGNTATKDIVIRREMRIHPGDVYNEDRVIRSLQRIYNLGYFADIGRNILIAPDGKNVDLELNITERQGTTKVNFGAGYSSLDGLVGTLELTWDNFDVSKLPFIWRCKGGGQQLRFSTEFGKRRTNFLIGFTEPWLHNHPIMVGFDIYKTHLVRSYYDDNRIGGDIYLGRPISEYSTLRLKYVYESVDIVSGLDNPNDLPDWVKDYLGNAKTSSLRVSLERDSRNNIFFASSGSDANIGVELAGNFLGGTVDYYRINMDNSWYFKIYWKTVLAVRLAGGYINNYGRTDKVPIYELFYLGGARTVRGYEEWEVGPKDENGNPEGGKVMAFSNFEYRIPIVKDTLYLLAFWDAGYCWREFSDFDLRDMQSGVGGGIRFDIPMLGLIGFDYGYGMSTKKGILHFNFGTTF